MDLITLILRNSIVKKGAIRFDLDFGFFYSEYTFRSNDNKH